MTSQFKHHVSKSQEMWFEESIAVFDGAPRDSINIRVTMYAAICEGKVAFSTMGQTLEKSLSTILTPSKLQSFHHIHTQCLALLTLNLLHEDLRVWCFSKKAQNIRFLG